jgi:hypothetical protein
LYLGFSADKIHAKSPLQGDKALADDDANIHGIDRLIHEPARLNIMHNSRGQKRRLPLTTPTQMSPELSAHLSKLAEAGYVG